jgi:hypothetical protein
MKSYIRLFIEFVASILVIAIVVIVLNWGLPSLIAGLKTSCPHTDWIKCVEWGLNGAK